MLSPSVSLPCGFPSAAAFFMCVAYEEMKEKKLRAKTCQAERDYKKMR